MVHLVVFIALSRLVIDKQLINQASDIFLPTGIAHSLHMRNSHLFKKNTMFPPILVQGRKKPRSDCLGQVNFALGQAKMEVWWPGGQVKLHVASAVLLVIIPVKNN